MSLVLNAVVNPITVLQVYRFLTLGCSGSMYGPYKTHNSADVHQNLLKTTENSVIITV